MSLSLATRRQRENILKGVLETAGDQPVSLITKASIIAGKDRRTGHQEFSHALLAAVDRRPDVELQSTLDRLIGAGLLFSQGVSPYATYLFKHALLCRTRPTARCCVINHARSTLASPKP